MPNKKTNTLIISAVKWSTITEVVAKFITPLSNMILARILLPEAFGVVALVTMVFSFADMLTDAGFQKYLIQHEFANEDELFIYANVAFWTNFAISLFLWFFIILYRNELATVLGNNRIGFLLAVSSSQLVLTSFSSIQIALYRRSFSYKKLFRARIVLIFIPLFITIPLALMGYSYWSIVCGSIVGQLVNSIILTIKSNWKPRFIYSLNVLKNMISFSMWSLLEAISIWATIWIDAFIIGATMSQYYLGIYRTSQLVVDSIMYLIPSAILPVLFTVLSRFQNDDVNFRNIFFKTQLYVSVIIIPLGIGIYIFSDFITLLVLGSNWIESSRIIGIWGLGSSLLIVFSFFNSEVYRAKGRPKISLLTQIIHLFFLVPALIISSQFGFWFIVYTRSIVRITSISIGVYFMKKEFNFKFVDTIKNLYPVLISTLIMGVFGFILKYFVSVSGRYDFIIIILCIFVYFSSIYTFANLREEIFKFISGNLIRK